MASRGERGFANLPSTRISPRSGLTIPNSISATSERPAPTRPKNPRISPARSSKLTSSTNVAPDRPRTLSAGFPIAASSFGKKLPGSAPIMCRTVCSTLRPAVGLVTTRLPERRIVTLSPHPRISSRKWLMNNSATPCVLRRPMISCRRSSSRPEMADVGSSRTSTRASRERARAISTD